MLHNLRKSWRLSLVTLVLLGTIFGMRDSITTALGVRSGFVFADDEDGWWWDGWWGDPDGPVDDDGDENNE